MSSNYLNLPQIIPTKNQKSTNTLQQGNHSFVLHLADRDSNTQLNTPSSDNMMEVKHRTSNNFYPNYNIHNNNIHNIHSNHNNNIHNNNMISQNSNQSNMSFHPSGVNEATSSINHSIRSSPASVEWLQENYESWEGVSIPRRNLYRHYLEHCCQHCLDAMNPASFGKLIRSVFPALSTRRLGTRGNSQYHYYGIRIKTTSLLNHPTYLPSRMPLKRRLVSVVNNQTPTPPQDNCHYLGKVPDGITSFDRLVVGDDEMGEELTQNDVLLFEMLYKEHCDAFVHIIVNLKFSLIEHLLRVFWRCEEDDGEIEARLPAHKLMLLSQVHAVKEWVHNTDLLFLQSITDILLPNILQPLPSSLIQSIRTFARNLTLWIGRLQGASDQMVVVKRHTNHLFCHHLRRLTCLNHLAQAAIAVLLNHHHTSQMTSDLSKLNMTALQQQSSWVNSCSIELLKKLHAEFCWKLQQHTTLQQWAEWLEEVIDRCLFDTPMDDPAYPQAAKNFLLKWSYYSSTLMRDLTLRSACSFGSFHLTRLLFDEYVLHAVLLRLAAATKQVAIAVIDVAAAEDAKSLKQEGFEGVDDGADKSKYPGILEQISNFEERNSNLSNHSSAYLEGVSVKLEKDLSGSGFDGGGLDGGVGDDGGSGGVDGGVGEYGHKKGGVVGMDGAFGGSVFSSGHSTTNLPTISTRIKPTIIRTPSFVTTTSSPNVSTSTTLKPIFSKTTTRCVVNNNSTLNATTLNTTTPKLPLSQLIANNKILKLNFNNNNNRPNLGCSSSGNHANVSSKIKNLSSNLNNNKLLFNNSINKIVINNTPSNKLSFTTLPKISLSSSSSSSSSLSSTTPSSSFSSSSSSSSLPKVITLNTKNFIKVTHKNDTDNNNNNNNCILTNNTYDNINNNINNKAT